MKILVTYNAYMEEGPTSTSIIEGKSIGDCLFQIIDKFSYPLDEEEFGEMNEEEAMDYLIERNGDGCDYIMSMVKIRDDEDILFES